MLGKVGLELSLLFGWGVIFLLFDLITGFGDLYINLVHLSLET